MPQDFGVLKFWNVLQLPCAALRRKIKLRANRWSLQDLNNKISVVNHRSTYVWNSTHYSASVLDQRELPKNQAAAWYALSWCSLKTIERSLKCFHSSFLCSHLLYLCPTAFLLPTSLSETIGSSCEVVKPSGTSLKRQQGLQMASISLPHANKAS